MADPKALVADDVDRRAGELVEVAQAIHARPELGYEERFASALLADVLADGGLAVERGAYGIETAFAGRAGDGDGDRDGPHVVVCCEYDALPAIGHGCGHNIIGAAGVGAGLALAPLVDQLGGRLTVLGTPAEELGGGGKIRLLDAGAFADADVAMMVHPSVADVGWAPHIATSRLRVAMHGRAAHAAAAPWGGRNALDAIVLGYSAVAALRQHLKPGQKVHGIITHGGDAENIIPDRAEAVFQVRSGRQRSLPALQERVLACFCGAAEQAGVRLEHEWIGAYAELLYNEPLATTYRRNGERVGRSFIADPLTIPLSVAGSTDMGDVSKAVPSLHAMIRIAELDVPGHSEVFRDAAASAEGDRAVVDGAKLLAMTAIDVWERPELVAATRTAFDEASAAAAPR